MNDVSNITAQESINLLENKNIIKKINRTKITKETITKLILSTPELCEILLKNKNKTYFIKYQPSKRKTYKISITLNDNK